MALTHAVSLVLDAHFPFVREEPPAVRRDAEGEPLPEEEREPVPETAEEAMFFEAVSETYLPLLGVLDRLENDKIPFKLALAVSPLLGQMLCDGLLMRKYEAHLDRQISFGVQELARLGTGDRCYPLAKRYLDAAVDRRIAFAVRYDGDILGALGHYGRKEKVELLATTATPAFLPFLSRYPETVQAQIEVGLSFFRGTLGVSPHGFWLPALGWSAEMDASLRAYGFDFTVAESHGFVHGSPAPSAGSFFPVRTPNGLFVLSRDHNAAADLARMRKEGPYRDNARDAGHELDAQRIAAFIAANGARCRTGYKYWQERRGEADASCDPAAPYDPDAAAQAADEHARAFLENCRDRLLAASAGMDGRRPVSLCAFEADAFGLRWHEGPRFLETMFRLAAQYRDLRFVTPSEYLYRQPVALMEVSTPAYSSWGENGYAEPWLDSSGDWIYRHLNRACERMVELAERFSGDSWVMERALNQAARELLLSQSGDWPAMLRRQESARFARARVETALRNFTTIYEAMGSNLISAEWLTDLEQRRGVFAGINYRVFKRKK